MRRGFDGLSLMAQDVLKQDPFSGALFCFRGRRGDLVKVLYWDGQGFCLFAKLRRSKFGASSERIERALEQLELALEEAETAKAEAVAAQPQQPEPEAANAEAQPAEEAKREKKKRRQLPQEFPRRDVVH